MTANFARKLHAQSGAATLLVALVLMMSVTTLTLSVARTTLYEQKIAANDHWNLRLSLQAASAMAQAPGLVNQDLDNLTWQIEPDSALQVSRIEVNSDDPQIQSGLELKRAPGAQDFILLESTARRHESSGLEVRTSRWIRRLSVLAPLAETAPPLVLAGCIHGEAADFHIRPWHADRDDAGEAVWTSSRDSCPPANTIDTHNGNMLPRVLRRDLWSEIFSVDRETFAELVSADAALADASRRYYRAQTTELHAGRWSHSLGDPTQHVVLQFPATLGCPEFAPGVRIFGIVFIDSSCAGPIARELLEIHGSLVINGDLDVTNAQLSLNHISLAEADMSRLRFPALRSIPVPGTWRDFW